MVQSPLGTLVERYKQGTRLRKKSPREAHAELRGGANRDAVAILAQEGVAETLPRLEAARIEGSVYRHVRRRRDQ